MAAATDQPAPKLVNLRQVPPASLDDLLEEEIGEWMARFHWDFRPSASLVRRYAAAGSLYGYVLELAGQTAGYVYYVYEDRKGLIGDLYIRKKSYATDHEVSLLRAAVEDLFEAFGVLRIESQVLLLKAPGRCALPFAERLSVYPRFFMTYELGRVQRLPPHPSARKTLVLNWSPQHQEEAARLIAAAYARHVDSQVNDQYRSVGGARRFLHNIVQYPGCGSFFPAASLVAWDPFAGRMCGICLASTLSPGTGHITQICVLPEYQGTGTGYELLRRCLLALQESRYTRASLTVTAANEHAVRLYESVGFRVSHEFSALVWEQPQ